MRNRFILASLLSLTLIIIPSFLAIATYIYRDEAPEELRERAWGSIKKARSEEAGKYANEELTQAERSYRTGDSMLKREAAKVYFLRNFNVSRSLFQEAMERAEEAKALAKEHRASLSKKAESRIHRAKEMEGRIVRLKKSFHLDSMSSLKWSRAKIALREAEIYYHAQEYPAAGEKASEAIKYLEKIWKNTIQVAERFIDSNVLQKWKGWINETIEYSKKNKTSALIVDKLDHTLILYKNGKWVRSFKADLGSNSINEKYYEGDNATPEGRYRIVQKRGKGRTKYYKALLLNYPNEDDKQRFQKARRTGKVSKNARIGGLIEIHGDGGREEDWTEGCVALVNEDMDLLFRQVSLRTPVTIVGCRYYNQEFAELIKRD
jgi:lipoprotein-anchoring transpeptidase ErfK/SrfK